MSLQILKNAGLLSMAKFSGDGLNFVLFIILSRQLGPEGIGEYAFGMAIALLVFSLVSFGLEDLSIRECAHLDAAGRARILGHLNGFQVALSLAIVIVFAGAMLSGRAPGTRMQVAGILSAYYMCLAVARILFAPAFAQQRMLGQAIAEMCCRVSVTTSAIVMVWFWHYPLKVALLAYPVGGVALLVVAASSAWRYNHQLRLMINWKRFLETFKTAWPFGASVLIFVLQVRISYIALGALKGAGATGIYASAIKFLETGVLPLTYLALSTYPSLSRAHLQDQVLFQRISDRLLRMSLAAGALLAWFLIIVLPVVIVPLLGASFSSAKHLLPAVGVLAVMMSIDLPVNRMLLAAKLQTLRVKFMIVGVVANLVLALLMIPFWGVPGALAATLLGQAAMTALSLRALFVRGVNPLTWKFGGPYLLSICAALVTGGGTGWLMEGEAWVAAVSLTTMCLTWFATGFISLKWVFGCHQITSSSTSVE